MAVKLCVCLFVVFAALSPLQSHAMSNADRLKAASDFQTLRLLQHALVFLPAAEREKFLPILSAMENTPLNWPEQKIAPWPAKVALPEADRENELSRAFHASLSLDAALLEMPCEDGGIGNDLMLAAYTLYDANMKLARLSGYEMPPFPAFSDQKPEDRQKHVLDEKELLSFWILTGTLAFLMLLLPVTKRLYSSFQKKLSARKTQ